MYGPTGTTASTSKEEAQENLENSFAKEGADHFYKNIILANDFDRYISDNIFCSDRSIPGPESTNIEDDTGLGYGTNNTYFGAYTRVISGTPSFICPQKNDAFTKDDIDKGNGKLEHKVGLITTDELIASGIQVPQSIATRAISFQPNEKHYLNKGKMMWTMTPSHFSGNEAYMSATMIGLYRYREVNAEAGTIDPVINIKSEYAKNFQGLGTITDPYHIKQKQFIVYFDTVGGDTDIESKVVNNEEPYGQLPTPTKEGYHFIGWFTSDGERLWESTFVSLTDNLTVYAKWGKNITITLDPTGGTINTTSILTYVGGTYDSLRSPTKEGYTFTGWYTDPVEGDKVTSYSSLKISEDHTLYAHWEVSKYTINFYLNDGTAPTGSKIVTYNEKYGELPTPTRTGYTFTGWYTSSTNGTQITADTICTTTKNHTLYAHWEINKYTITFNPNGGATPTASKTVTYNETYGTLPKPTRSGYVFLGWFTSTDGGSHILINTKVTILSNQTLYAHWAIAVNYTVTSLGNTDDYENSPSLTSACYYARKYANSTFTYNGKSNCVITSSSCTNTNSSSFECTKLAWKTQSGTGTQNGYWVGTKWGARCTTVISCPQ